MRREQGRGGDVAGWRLAFAALATIVALAALAAFEANGADRGVAATAALCVALLCLAALGLIGLDNRDPVVAGRSGGVFANGCAMALVGGLGALWATTAWVSPLEGAGLVIGALVGLALAAVLIAGPWRAASAPTTAEFLEERFGPSAVRPLAAMAAAAGLALVLAGALGGVRVALEASAPWLPVDLVWVAAAVLLFAAAARGGLTSETRLAPVLIGVVLIALYGVGLWAAATSGATPLPQIAAMEISEAVAASLLLDPSAGAVASSYAGDGDRWSSALALGLAMAGGVAAAPPLLARCVAAQNVPAARSATLWAAILGALILTLAPFFAALTTAGALGLLSDGGAAAASAPVLTQTWPSGDDLGPDAAPILGFAIAAERAWVDVALALAAIAGLIGLAIGAATALSAIVVFDVAERVFDPRLDSRDRRRLAQGAIAIAAAAAAWQGPSTALASAEWIGWGVSILGAGLFAPLVVGVWWSRATAQGALAGVFVGVGVAAFYIIGVEAAPVWWVETFGTADGALLSLKAELQEAVALGEPASALQQRMFEIDRLAAERAGWLGAPSAAAGAFGMIASLIAMALVSVLSPKPSAAAMDFLDGIRAPKRRA